MSEGVEGVEGVGGAVTGGILARAVESAAGEGRPGEGQGLCLNCSTPLAGAYCHQCGQRGHVHRTLTAFGHDLAHAVLHFDGKFWRTLPMLAWRPGELTRRYVDGQRARFVSPMAMFLFSVFLMFAVFGTIGGPTASNLSADPAAQEQLRQERQAAKTRLAALEREKAELVAHGAPAQAIDGRIAEARAEVGALGAVSGEEDFPGLTVESGRNLWLDRAYQKAKQNPALLAYKLQANGYKFSWALIPLSVPFVWLLFAFRRQYKAYDHTVFVTYSIAFMTLLVVAVSLWRATGVATGLIAPIVAFVPPVHMYRQLRGAYRLSRLAALWRTAFLVLFALVAALLFFLLLVAVGVM